MYDFEWHKTHGDKTSSSALVALQQLKRYLSFDSVLDVGCGDGRWLSACQALGVSEILGVDGPWTDRERLLIEQTSFREADLSRSLSVDRRFDLAMSLEVAEHVPWTSAKTFVENLIRHADAVLFAAAIPYQGGFRHINERWPSYWEAIFRNQGYVALDPLRAMLWDRDDVFYWYKQNMLLYINAERQDLLADVRRRMAEDQVRELPLDIVHPTKFEAIASYQQIAFKPMLKQLPYRLLLKAKALALREV